MVEKEQIDNIFNRVIQNKQEIIEDEKCSKPHIQSLPYDGNARTEGKLNHRKEVIEARINDAKTLIKEHEDFIKELENTKKNLNKELEKQEKDLKSHEKNVENSKKHIDNSMEDANDIMKDYVGNVFNDDMNEIGMLWINWGFGKEFNQIDGLSQKLYTGLGTLGKDVGKLYDKGKFSDSKLNNLIKTSSKLSKLLDKTYNKKNGNVILPKSASSQVNRITHKLEDVRDGVNSYNRNVGYVKQSEDTIKQINNDIESADYHISNSKNSINSLEQQIVDYNEELGKVNIKLDDA